jgi:LEA14-like dessication related protein
MRIAILAALLTALAGCSFLPKFETPRLSIVNVELVKSELFEQRLKVRLRVQNPNDRALPVKGVSYRLEVGGEDFAQGVSASSFNVPAFGEAEFDMNVTANMAAALIRIATQGGSAERDAIDYRMVGKVSLANGVLRSIPFEEKGSFKLK